MLLSRISLENFKFSTIPRKINQEIDRKYFNFSIYLAVNRESTENPLTLSLNKEKPGKWACKNEGKVQLFQELGQEHVENRQPDPIT